MEKPKRAVRSKMEGKEKRKSETRKTTRMMDSEQMNAGICPMQIDATKHKDPLKNVKRTMR